MNRPDGMPDELWAAVWAAGEASRKLMLRHWATIGEGGRRALGEYIRKGWTRHSRRQRGQRAAEQLMSPEAGTGIFWSNVSAGT